MRILVTGGAGFLGWHTVGALLDEDPRREVVNLDLLTYAGSRRAVADLERRFPERHRFIRGDVRDPVTVQSAMSGVVQVVHLAAETHVDHSIRDAGPFVETNVAGTQVVLDAARRAGVEAVLLASTDEVYGHLPLERGEAGALGSASQGRSFAETDSLRPRSPYAASKAAAELLGLAAYETHGLPVLITRGCNAYGPGQYPEKLLPLAISRVREGRPIPIYGEGHHIREWIHAADQAAGIVAALERGRPGEAYNLGGGESFTNMELVRLLLSEMGTPGHPVEHVTDRPGHDLRYALDAGKARRELGWSPRRTLAGELGPVVAWYRRKAAGWWERGP